MDELIKNIKKDTSLHSSLDINSILSTATTTTTRHYLNGKTMHYISKEINEVINSIQYFTQEQKEKLLGVLDGYLFIDHLCDLQNSYYLRLIPRTSTKKQTGGVLVGVKFLSTGTDIMILSGKRILQFKIDEYYIFMKLNQEDKLILLLNK
jgi:hypothetical protein